MRGGHRHGAGRRGWRRKCEHLLRLDIGVLRQRGRLNVGQYFGWHWLRNDERIAEIGIHTFAASIELIYTWTPRGYEPRNIRCRVALTRTPCRFGGERQWFICPDCARMCAVVFGVSRHGNFACRVCQRLAYASEAESPIDRCWRQQRKLELKVGENLKRPKGMKHKTHKRIVRRWTDIEERKDALWWPMVARFLGHEFRVMTGN